MSLPSPDFGDPETARNVWAGFFQHPRLRPFFQPPPLLPFPFYLEPYLSLFTCLFEKKKKPRLRKGEGGGGRLKGSSSYHTILVVVVELFRLSDLG